MNLDTPTFGILEPQEGRQSVALVNARRKYVNARFTG